MRGRIRLVPLLVLAALCSRRSAAQEISEGLRFEWKVSELSWSGDQHDEALRILRREPDRALNVLVRELPEWGRQNPRRLPGLITGLKELVPLASPESRALAMGSFAHRGAFSKEVRLGVDETPRMLAVVIVEALGEEGLEGLGEALTLQTPRCENPLLASTKLRGDLTSWASRTVRNPEEDRGKRVKAAMLLSCFDAKGIEALRQNKEQSIDLLVEALLAQSHDTEPPRAALTLSTLDLQGSADHLATLVEGADGSRRAAALRSLGLLLPTVEFWDPPFDIARLTPVLLAEAKSPCGQGFRPAVRLLGALRTQSAVLALGESLKHPCAGWAYSDVLLALGRLRNPESIDALLETMKDVRNPRPVREGAGRVLTQMTEARAYRPAFRYLDPWWGRRSTALWTFVLLCLFTGPFAVLVRRRVPDPAAVAAYCGVIALLGFGALELAGSEGGSRAMPPGWAFVSFTLMAIVGGIWSAEASYGRKSSVGDSLDRRQSFASAAGVFALGWLSLVAGFISVLVFLFLMGPFVFGSMRW